MFAGSSPALAVQQTGPKGRGLFALAPVRKGTRVLAIEGTIYASAAVPPDCFAMQIGTDLWLCSDGKSLDDCINHSCTPNLGFIRHDPVLYALRDIAAGEELSWDYSTSIAEKGWKLDCLCGSKQCRGTILPFGELTAPQQRALLPIALAYLQPIATAARHVDA